MKLRIHGPLISLVCILLSAPGADALASSPLLGTWKLDTSKLSLPAGGMPPKSVLLTVTAAGAPRWKIVFQTVNADGTARRAEANFPLDGTPAVVSDTARAEVNAVSVTCPNDRTMVWGTSSKGRPTDTHVFTVSESGQDETETVGADDAA